MVGKECKKRRGEEHNPTPQHLYGHGHRGGALYSTRSLDMHIVLHTGLMEKAEGKESDMMRNEIFFLAHFSIAALVSYCPHLEATQAESTVVVRLHLIQMIW